MSVKTPVLTNYSSQTGEVRDASIDANFNVADRIAWPFAPHEQLTPDMTVKLEAGYISAVGELPLEVAAQSTGIITPPSANPRRDIVYIDAADGTVGVVTGEEDANPVDPEIPEGKVAVARINLSTSQTVITNEDIDDLRCAHVVFPEDLVKSLIPHDLSFTAGLGADGEAEDMAVQRYGRAVVGRDFTVTGEVIDMEEAPTDDNDEVGAVFDFLVNGVSIYTTPPEVAPGETTGTAGELNTASVDLSAGDIVELYCTQVGITTAGKLASITLKGNLR